MMKLQRGRRYDLTLSMGSLYVPLRDVLVEHVEQPDRPGLVHALSSWGQVLYFPTEAVAWAQELKEA